MGNSTDSTLNFTGDLNFADGIQALESDGFQVGTDGQVNASGRTYHYIGFVRTAIPSVTVNASSNSVAEGSATATLTPTLSENTSTNATTETQPTTDGESADAAPSTAPGPVLTNNRPQLPTQQSSGPSSTSTVEPDVARQPANEPEQSQKEEEEPPEKAGCASFLALAVNLSPNLIVERDRVIYTVTFVNSSEAQTVTGGILRAVLPPEMIFISATDEGSEENGVVNWDIGRIPPGTIGSRIAVVEAAPIRGDSLLTTSRVVLEDFQGLCAQRGKIITVRAGSDRKRRSFGRAR